MKTLHAILFAVAVALTSGQSTAAPDILGTVGPAPMAPAVTAATPEAARALEAYGAAVDRYTETVRKAVRATDLDLLTRTEIAAGLSRIDYERRSAERTFAALGRPTQQRAADQVAAR